MDESGQNFEYIRPFSRPSINLFYLFRYLSSSPPPLSPEGREEDIDAILKVIRGAKRFVHIAVMDFVPMFLYDRRRVSMSGVIKFCSVDL